MDLAEKLREAVHGADRVIVKRTRVPLLGN